MEHIAIMKKSWGLTRKIFTGRKSIESRWYNTKRVPWNRIKIGETIYFKDSGEPVSLKAEVDKVVQYSNLKKSEVQKIIDVYRNDIGLGSDELPEFFEMIKEKKYCILMFLKNPMRVEAFEIDKSGFGAMSAWITVNDIGALKSRIE